MMEVLVLLISAIEFVTVTTLFAIMLILKYF